jgi:hypothetical protein
VEALGQQTPEVTIGGSCRQALEDIAGLEETNNQQGAKPGRSSFGRNE